MYVSIQHWAGDEDDYAMAQEEHEVVVQVEHPRELPPAWRHCTPVRRCIGRDTVSSGPLLLHLHCHHVPLRHAYASTDM